MNMSSLRTSTAAAAISNLSVMDLLWAKSFFAGRDLAELEYIKQRAGTQKDMMLLAGISSAESENTHVRHLVERIKFFSRLQDHETKKEDHGKSTHRKLQDYLCEFSPEVKGAISNLSAILGLSTTESSSSRTTNTVNDKMRKTLSSPHLKNDFVPPPPTQQSQRMKYSEVKRLQRTIAAARKEKKACQQLVRKVLSRELEIAGLSSHCTNNIMNTNEHNKFQQNGAVSITEISENEKIVLEITLSVGSISNVPVFIPTDEIYTNLRLALVASDDDDDDDVREEESEERKRKGEREKEEQEQEPRDAQLPSSSRIPQPMSLSYSHRLMLAPHPPSNPILGSHSFWMTSSRSSSEYDGENNHHPQQQYNYLIVNTSSIEGDDGHRIATNANDAEAGAADQTRPKMVVPPPPPITWLENKGSLLSFEGAGGEGKGSGFFGIRILPTEGKADLSKASSSSSSRFPMIMITFEPVPLVYSSSSSELKISSSPQQEDTAKKSKQQVDGYDASLPERLLVHPRSDETNENIIEALKRRVVKIFTDAKANKSPPSLFSTGPKKNKNKKMPIIDADNDNNSSDTNKSSSFAAAEFGDISSTDVHRYLALSALETYLLAELEHRVLLKKEGELHSSVEENKLTSTIHPKRDNVPSEDSTEASDRGAFAYHHRNEQATNLEEEGETSKGEKTQSSSTDSGKDALLSLLLLSSGNPSPSSSFDASVSFHNNTYDAPSIRLSTEIAVLIQNQIMPAFDEAMERIGLNLRLSRQRQLIAKRANNNNNNNNDGGSTSSSSEDPVLEMLKLLDNDAHNSNNNNEKGKKILISESEDAYDKATTAIKHLSVDFYTQLDPLVLVLPTRTSAFYKNSLATKKNYVGDRHDPKNEDASHDGGDFGASKRGRVSPPYDQNEYQHSELKGQKREKEGSGREEEKLPLYYTSSSSPLNPSSVFANQLRERISRLRDERKREVSSSSNNDIVAGTSHLSSSSSASPIFIDDEYLSTWVIRWGQRGFFGANLAAAAARSTRQTTNKKFTSTDTGVGDNFIFVTFNATDSFEVAVPQVQSPTSSSPQNELENLPRQPHSQLEESNYDIILGKKEKGHEDYGGFIHQDVGDNMIKKSAKKNNVNIKKSRREVDAVDHFLVADDLDNEANNNNDGEYAMNDDSNNNNNNNNNNNDDDYVLSDNHDAGRERNRRGELKAKKNINNNLVGRKNMLQFYEAENEEDKEEERRVRATTKASTTAYPLFSHNSRTSSASSSSSSSTESVMRSQNKAFRRLYRKTLSSVKNELERFFLPTGRGKSNEKKPAFSADSRSSMLVAGVDGDECPNNLADAAFATQYVHQLNPTSLVSKNNQQEQYYLEGRSTFSSHTHTAPPCAWRSFSHTLKVVPMWIRRGASLSEYLQQSDEKKGVDEKTKSEQEEREKEGGPKLKIIPTNETSLFGKLENNAPTFVEEEDKGETNSLVFATSKHSSKAAAANKNKKIDNDNNTIGKASSSYVGYYKFLKAKYATPLLLTTFLEEEEKKMENDDNATTASAKESNTKEISPKPLLVLPHVRGFSLARSLPHHRARSTAANNNKNKNNGIIDDSVVALGGVIFKTTAIVPVRRQEGTSGDQNHIDLEDDNSEKEQRRVSDNDNKKKQQNINAGGKDGEGIRVGDTTPEMDDEEKEPFNMNFGPAARHQKTPVNEYQYRRARDLPSTKPPREPTTSSSRSSYFLEKQTLEVVVRCDPSPVSSPSSNQEDDLDFFDLAVTLDDTFYNRTTLPPTGGGEQKAAGTHKNDDGELGDLKYFVHALPAATKKKNPSTTEIKTAQARSKSSLPLPKDGKSTSTTIFESHRRFRIYLKSRRACLIDRRSTSANGRNEDENGNSLPSSKNGQPQGKSGLANENNANVLTSIEALWTLKKLDSISQTTLRTIYSSLNINKMSNGDDKSATTTSTSPSPLLLSGVRSSANKRKGGVAADASALIRGDFIAWKRRRLTEFSKTMAVSVKHLEVSQAHTTKKPKEENKKSAVDSNEYDDLETQSFSEQEALVANIVNNEKSLMDSGDAADLKQKEKVAINSEKNDGGFFDSGRDFVGSLGEEDDTLPIDRPGAKSSPRSFGKRARTRNKFHMISVRPMNLTALQGYLFKSSITPTRNQLEGSNALMSGGEQNLILLHSSATWQQKEEVPTVSSNASAPLVLSDKVMLAIHCRQEQQRLPPKQQVAYKTPSKVLLLKEKTTNDVRSHSSDSSRSHTAADYHVASAIHFLIGQNADHKHKHERRSLLEYSSFTTQQREEEKGKGSKISDARRPFINKPHWFKIADQTEGKVLLGRCDEIKTPRIVGSVVYTESMMSRGEHKHARNIQNNLLFENDADRSERQNLKISGGNNNNNKKKMREIVRDPPYSPKFIRKLIDDSFSKTELGRSQFSSAEEKTFSSSQTTSSRRSQEREGTFASGLWMFATINKDYTSNSNNSGNNVSHHLTFSSSSSSSSSAHMNSPFSFMSLAECLELASSNDGAIVQYSSFRSAVPPSSHSSSSEGSSNFSHEGQRKGVKGMKGEITTMGDVDKDDNQGDDGAGVLPLDDDNFHANYIHHYRRRSGSGSVRENTVNDDVPADANYVPASNVNTCPAPQDSLENREADGETSSGVIVVKDISAAATTSFVSSQSKRKRQPEEVSNNDGESTFTSSKKRSAVSSVCLFMTRQNLLRLINNNNNNNNNYKQAEPSAMDHDGLQTPTKQEVPLSSSSSSSSSGVETSIIRGGGGGHRYYLHYVLADPTRTLGLRAIEEGEERKRISVFDDDKNAENNMNKKKKSSEDGPLVGGGNEQQRRRSYEDLEGLLIEKLLEGHHDDDDDENQNKRADSNKKIRSARDDTFSPLGFSIFTINQLHL